MENVTFLTATQENVGTILYFIRELAQYEKMLDQVAATEELPEQEILGKPSSCCGCSMFPGVESTPPERCPTGLPSSALASTASY